MKELYKKRYEDVIEAQKKMINFEQRWHKGFALIGFVAGFVIAKLIFS